MTELDPCRSAWVLVEATDINRADKIVGLARSMVNLTVSLVMLIEEDE